MMRPFIAFLVIVTPITAAAAPREDPLIEAEHVGDAELDRQRGGFRYEGVEIQLGAEIRSYLDNHLVMQTNVSWTANGGEVTRMVSGALTPASAAQLQAGVVGTGVVSMNVGADKVYVANGGQTAFIQRDEGALQNIVLNTADNVAIRQEVDVTMDLKNFAPLQTQFRMERMSEALGAMVGAAGRGW